MKTYAIIKDGEVVFGPRRWSVPSFAEYLNQNEYDYTSLSKQEPDSVVEIDDLRIVQVMPPLQPPYDSQYQQLSGPFWSVLQNKVVGRFNIVSKSVEQVKSELRQRLSQKRYDIENSRISIEKNGKEYFFETSREFRKFLSEQLTLLDFDDTINYKYSSTEFVVLTKEDLLAVAKKINTYVQSIFGWEMEKLDQIRNAITVEDLKNIDLRTAREIEIQEARRNNPRMN